MIQKSSLPENPQTVSKALKADTFEGLADQPALIAG
jgi:hypothetical protein